MSKETESINLWSFSRVTSHEQCPLQYKMKYIDGFEEEENGWGVLGTYCHEILELYAKKQIEIPQMVEYYVSNYPEPVFPTLGRTDLAVKYRHECYEFFKNFRGFSTEVVGVERDFKMHIEGNNYLRGFIDLETFDGENYTNVDYKISNPFKGEELKKKRRQLYLYSRATKEKFGKFPKFMYFYFIKANSYIQIPFNEADYHEAWEWLSLEINKIQNAETHQAKPDRFYCGNLCGFRYQCPQAAGR